MKRFNTDFWSCQWALAQWYLERIQKSHFASHVRENSALFCCLSVSWRTCFSILFNI